MSRIRCHSAFKHYEIFHGNKACCGGGSGNTSIFVNCKGHDGGFWGGFGLGLGNWFGNILGGFAGNLFGGFSGFGGFGGGMGFGGMMGMGGFGFPGMGGGSWGLWGNQASNGTCNCDGNSSTAEETGKRKSKTEKSRTVGDADGEKVDPDRETINNLWARKNELLAKKAPNTATAEELQKLLDDIKEAEASQNKNEIHDDTDNTSFDLLKYGLEDMIKAAQKRTPVNKEGVQPENTEGQPEVPANGNPAASGANNGQEVAPDGEVQPTTRENPASNPVAGETTANIQKAKTLDDLAKALPDGDLNKLTEAEKEAYAKKLKNILSTMNINDIQKLQPKDAEKIINSLSPDQAKDILTRLAAKTLLKNGKNTEGIKATTNYVTLLLAQKAGMPLAAGHNSDLDGISGADPYLHGKISNVKMEGDVITFEIEDNNGIYKMSCKPDSKIYTIEALRENKTQKYQQIEIGEEYEIKDDDNDEYAVRKGNAAIHN